MKRRVLLFVASGFAATLFCSDIYAQDWPQRSPTLIVPFVAGGGADVVARLVGAEMGKHLGRSVVVEKSPRRVCSYWSASGSAVSA